MRNKPTSDIVEEIEKTLDTLANNQVTQAHFISSLILLKDRIEVLNREKNENQLYRESFKKLGISLPSLKDLKIDDLAGEHYLDDTVPCFECGYTLGEKQDHHVIPRSLGGTKTIPLCLECHGKSHYRKKFASSFLIKEGLQKAKLKGRVGGRKKVFTDDHLKTARNLINKGYSQSKIAGMLGFHRSTLCRELNK